MAEPGYPIRLTRDEREVAAMLAEQELEWLTEDRHLAQGRLKPKIELLSGLARKCRRGLDE